MSRARRWAVPLAALAAGCAWSNPDNRPVWNAFEQGVVPRGDVAFYSTLLLTAPVGLGAILTDTLVVHPACVLDDAAGDAGDLWDDLEWQKHYYTELGFLPLRAAVTPVVFLGSFLGRACFDIPPRKPRDPEARAAEAAKAAAEARVQCLAYFAALARQDDEAPAPQMAPLDWDADLATAFDRALQAASSRGRHSLYRAATRLQLPPLAGEAWLGLRDADPVVRYLELQALARDCEVPVGLRDALLADPNEMVRLLAKERLR